MKEFGENAVDILFPKGVFKKHPNSSEIIKLAESQGIGVNEIAELLGKLQPQISQVKAGKGFLKTEELKPLIYRLSPKAPGESFYVERIFKELKPSWPDEWEKNFISKACQPPSRSSCYHKLSFKEIQEEHYNGIKNNTQIEVQASSRNMANLKEMLQRYTQEKEARTCRANAIEEKIDQCIEKYSTILTGMKDSESLQNAIETLIRPSIEQAEGDSSGKKDSGSLEARLIEACNQAAMDIGFPNLTDEEGEGVYLAPEKHASRIISEWEKNTQKIQMQQEEKKKQYALTGQFSAGALDDLMGLKFKFNEEPDISDWGQQLFSDSVMQVYFRDESFEVNLAEAFNNWSEDEINFEVEEEDVQICGHHLNTGNCIARVYELHSQDFVIVHEISIEDKETALLSERLTVSKLFDYLKSNSLDEVLPEIKEALVRRGYRVPSIRSIY